VTQTPSIISKVFSSILSLEEKTKVENTTVAINDPLAPFSTPNSLFLTLSPFLTYNIIMTKKK